MAPKRKPARGPQRRPPHVESFAGSRDFSISNSEFVQARNVYNLHIQLNIHVLQAERSYLVRNIFSVCDSTVMGSTAPIELTFIFSHLWYSMLQNIAVAVIAAASTAILF
ncbi:hypothetical protein FA15DRAFT_665258 [Coprinopsis marcescibilis]|uniref:Uncharacterized protein n=1 Tax=Coprinopsis marcescibilis TaxID=230819 RepID=A0A5C3L697_COPMA|nr:hypothetical protein FA15DRAFT_665258 [Coprinopsis marcescibilis]